MHKSDNFEKKNKNISLRNSTAVSGQEAQNLHILANFFLQKLLEESAKDPLHLTSDTNKEYIEFVLTGRNSLLAAFLKLALWVNPITSSKKNKAAPALLLEKSPLAISKEDSLILKRYLEKLQK